MALTMNNKQIREIKKRAVKYILDTIKPHFWQTDYLRYNFLEGPDEHINIWMPNKNSCDPVQMHKNLVIKTLFGITEDGIAIGGFCGGLVICEWNHIPLEDLNRICKLVQKKLNGEDLWT